MKKKIILIILSVVLAAIVLFGGRYIYRTLQYKDIISNIEVTNPSLVNIEDGTYVGSFDAILIKAKVEVIMVDHKIKDIILIKHENERGKKAESIIKNVVSEQSLNVDIVTGATNSSKVILKAIDNALVNAPLETQ